MITSIVVAVDVVLFLNVFIPIYFIYYILESKTKETLKMLHYVVRIRFISNKNENGQIPRWCVILFEFISIGKLI